MKARSVVLGSFAVVAAFALVTMAAAGLTLSSQANARAADATQDTSGADVSGHPDNETNGVPPGPTVWLNDTAPYGPPEWYNESGGTPTWLALP